MALKKQILSTDLLLIVDCMIMKIVQTPGDSKYISTVTGGVSYSVYLPSLPGKDVVNAPSVICVSHVLLAAL